MDWNDDNWNLLAYMRGPSCVPGLAGKDVLEGSVGQGKNGHSLYERDATSKQLLLDEELQSRVAFWMRPKAFSLKELKAECKSNGIPVGGSKGALALKLAFNELPEDVEASAAEGYAITESSPHKWGGKRVRADKMVKGSKDASSDKKKVTKKSQAAKSKVKASKK